jgi:DNA-binding MarR family transcriptional regulator
MAPLGARTEEGSEAEELLAEAAELYQSVARRLRAMDAFQLDLTMRQLRAVMAISEGAATVNEIAASLGIAQPTASLLVDRLVRLDLVERVEDPRDRRRAPVRLTSRGEGVVTRWLGDIRARLTAGLIRLPPDDLATLARGLRALLSAIEPARAG